MPSRREFLQTGAAVSAIAANAAIVRSAEALGASAPVSLGAALHDDRYAEGVRFASAAAALGVRTYALDSGDVTPFFHQLEALWKRGPSSVAGFTQFGPMLVVERLALERGMRLAMRVEHCVASDGSLTHRFASPAATLALAAGADARHSDWPRLMALLACRVGGDDGAQCSGELVTVGLARPAMRHRGAELASSFIHYYTPHAEQQGYGPALDGRLYTWVVAPRAQRG